MYGQCTFLSPQILPSTNKEFPWPYDVLSNLKKTTNKDGEHPPPSMVWTLCVRAEQCFCFLFGKHPFYYDEPKQKSTSAMIHKAGGKTYTPYSIWICLMSFTSIKYFVVGGRETSSQTCGVKILKIGHFGPNNVDCIGRFCPSINVKNKQRRREAGRRVRAVNGISPIISKS